MKNSFFFSDYTGADQPLTGSVASNTDVWMDSALSFLGVPDVVAKFQAANWQVRLQTCLVILQRQRAIDQFIAVANTLDEAKIPWWIHIEQAFGHGGEVSTAASYTATPKDGVRALPDWNYGTGILGKAVSGVTGQATPTQFYNAYGEYPALWWNTPIEEYENRFGGALDQLIGQGWTNLVGF